MIQRVNLRDFMAFERFRLDLRGDAYLAGPNNAGKSTLITAIRVAAQMLRVAVRRNPTETFLDGGAQVLGYSFSNNQVSLDGGNLPHEFREVEPRLALRLRNGATLTAVWSRDPDDPYFYLQHGRASINNVRQARDAFPEIGIVPVLAPVESEEELLTPKYVRENLDTRLASRHFRNQLLLLDEDRGSDDLEAFLNFAAPWIPEIKVRELGRHMGDKNFILDLYYTDIGRRALKELVWAGDGMQIWLQLLLHIFRLRNRDVVVLDEPDVFLHPDLQRRLVWLLDALPGQTITATHSSEVLVEAAPESVIWVDKSRRASVSSPAEAQLVDLSISLGTQFNIRLARALRARCVLFVEGKDAKTLRHLARAVGALRTATETGIAVIPLRGFDNWEHVEPFSWMAQDLLEAAVEVFVLLDRDYRSDSECTAVTARLRRLGHCHIWRRKELESYLLEAKTISRLTGAAEGWVDEALADAADQWQSHVFAQVTARALRRYPHDQKTQAITEGKSLFDEAWHDRATRKWVAPPEQVLHGLNQQLAAAGHSPTSFAALARRMCHDEVPDEVRRFLSGVEDALEAAGVPQIPG